MSERQPDFGNPANIPSSVGSTAEKIPHSGKLPEEMREQPLPGVPENLEVFYETDYKGVNSGEIPLLKVKESLVQPTETAEKESNTKKRLIPAFLATGGAALSIVAGIYIGNQLSGDTEAPKEPTKVEAEESSSNESANTTEIKKTPEQQELEEILNMPKPERFDELEAMTIEQFNQQPIEDRAAYAMYLNRDKKNQAELWYQETKNPRDKLAIDLVVGPDNTAEEITANIRSLNRGAMTRHFVALKTPLYNALQREKIVCGTYLDPNGTSALAWRKAAQNEEQNGYVPGLYAMNGVMLADETVFDISENFTGDDGRIKRVMGAEEQDGQTFAGPVTLVETELGLQWVEG